MDQIGLGVVVGRRGCRSVLESAVSAPGDCDDRFLAVSIQIPQFVDLGWQVGSKPEVAEAILLDTQADVDRISQCELFAVN